MLSIVELGVIPVLLLEARLAMLLRSTGVCEGDSLEGEAQLSSRDPAKPLTLGVDLPDPLLEEGVGECDPLNEKGDLDRFFLEFDMCSMFRWKVPIPGEHQGKGSTRFEANKHRDK